MPSSRRARLELQREEREKRKGTRPAPVHANTIDELVRIYVSGQAGRILPTQRDFILSPERIKWYKGPVGCAKTSSLVASIVIPCMLYPGSRAMLARWTYSALEQTTLKRFDDLAKHLPGLIVEDQVGPPRTVWIASAFPGEEPSELLFRSLDEESKLGSTEFNFIGVDEANEITKEMVNMLNDRLRHKLPNQQRPEGPFFLNLVSNPVTHSHFLHNQFCTSATCGGQVERDGQPMGTVFKPRAKENEDNLPPGYYEDIAVGKSAQEIARFIHGECGPDPSGKPVYSQFNMSLHVGKLHYLPYGRMCRFWDFGYRRPACVFMQPTKEGWHNYLHAVIGENETTEAFVERMKLQSSLLYPSTDSWIDICDPAGAQKKSNSEESDIDIMRRLGINPFSRETLIKSGMEAVGRSLSTIVKGRPRLMVDSSCRLLIDAFSSGYKFPEARPDKPISDKPRKDGYYEHVMDALRYGEINLGMVGNSTQQQHAHSLRYKGNRS